MKNSSDDKVVIISDSPDMGKWLAIVVKDETGADAKVMAPESLDSAWNFSPKVIVTYSEAPGAEVHWVKRIKVTKTLSKVSVLAVLPARFESGADARLAGAIDACYIHDYDGFAEKLQRILIDTTKESLSPVEGICAFCGRAAATVQTLKCIAVDSLKASLASGVTATPSTA